jgi:hypothetical protein
MAGGLTGVNGREMGCYSVVGGDEVVLSFVLSGGMLVALSFYLLSTMEILISPFPSHTLTHCHNKKHPVGCRKYDRAHGCP